MTSLSSDCWVGIRKGAWSKEEDNLLRQCVEKYDEGNWHLVPWRAGLRRCRKSCRLRWLNYLTPDIKRGQFSEDEKDLIIRMHRLLGNRWSLIARRIPGRTANDVKNYRNCYMSKPQISVTRKPIPKKAPAAEPVRSTVLVKPQAHRIKMKAPHRFRKAASSSRSTEGQFPDEDLQGRKLMLTTHESQDNALFSGICLDLAGGEEFASDQAALLLESEVQWEDPLFDSELWNLLDVEQSALSYSPFSVDGL